MKKEIFIVNKNSGVTYNNSPAIPVCAFTNKEKATEYAEALNDKLTLVRENCSDTCEDNALYAIRIISDKHIEEDYPELWAKMNSISDQVDDLLWEEVDNIEYKFEQERDSFIEYARKKAKEGVIEESYIDDIIKYYAYSDTFEIDNTQPFYTVTKGVELIED